MSHAIPLRELLAGLPPEWPHDVLGDVQALNRALGRVVVALDDDPTGTQTVHGIDVLTEWSVESLAGALAPRPPAFYVLTNSRSLTAASAAALAAEIGHNLGRAARQTGVDVAVISRSDSTLRGHYPAEVDALEAALGAELGAPFAAQIIAPFFFDGGRLTVNDTHYVREGDDLVPAGETEFARDSAFGYRASNLPAWVEEKTAGRVAAADVRSVSLDDIRQGGPARVAELLRPWPGGRVAIINAASERDIEVAALGALQAEAAGDRYLYRTAASFVRARAGIPRRDLLAPGELLAGQGGRGGLVVVGSYIQKSSVQLAALLGLPGIEAVELSVGAVLAGGAAAEAARAAAALDRALGDGRVGVVHTSRALVTGQDGAASLAIGQAVSAALVDTVRRVAARPRYLIAKGGITSSDTATKALGIRRARVLGQLLPGVPVWRAGAESRWPDLPYIVFPGNVGGPDALAQAVASLDRR